MQSDSLISKHQPSSPSQCNPSTSTLYDLSGYVIAMCVFLPSRGESPRNALAQKPNPLNTGPLGSICRFISGSSLSVLPGKNEPLISSAQLNRCPPTRWTLTDPDGETRFRKLRMKRIESSSCLVHIVNNECIRSRHQQKRNVEGMTEAHRQTQTSTRNAEDS